VWWGNEVDARRWASPLSEGKSFYQSHVISLCENYGSARRMQGGGACCGVSGVYGAGATLRFRDDTPFGLPLQPRFASTTQRPTDFAYSTRFASPLATAPTCLHCTLRASLALTRDFVACRLPTASLRNGDEGFLELEGHRDVNVIRLGVS